MDPRCRKMAPRSFQAPSWPHLVALGSLLRLLRAILGRLGAILGPSKGDLGALQGGYILKDEVSTDFGGSSFLRLF